MMLDDGTHWDAAGPISRVVRPVILNGPAKN